MIKRVRSLVVALALVGLGAAVHAAATNGNTQNVARDTCTLQADASLWCVLKYTNASTGRFHSTRIVRIPNVQTQPIVDDGGVTLASQVPTALFSAIATLNSQIDTTIASAAAAGKLDLSTPATFEPAPAGYEIGEPHTRYLPTGASGLSGLGVMIWRQAVAANDNTYPARRAAGQ